MSFQHEKSELQPSALPTQEAEGVPGNHYRVNKLKLDLLLLLCLRFWMNSVECARDSSESKLNFDNADIL